MDFRLNVQIDADVLGLVVIVGGHTECGGVIAAYKMAYPEASIEKLCKKCFSYK